MVTEKNTELLSKVLGNAEKIDIISHLSWFLKSLLTAVEKLYERSVSLHIKNFTFW